jgi:hypothetical protein
MLNPVAVAIGAAQPHSEGAGEGGLHAPGIRAGMSTTVPHNVCQARPAPPTSGASPQANPAPRRAAGQVSRSSRRAAAQPNRS